MTLEEAIKNYEKVAEEKEKQAIWVWSKEDNSYYEDCIKVAKKLRQLAEWLRELKAYRDTYKNYSKVEKMLICEVEKAKENPGVKKPISYGLYQTWKFWDKNEVVREVNADEASD